MTADLECRYIAELLAEAKARGLLVYAYPYRATTFYSVCERPQYIGPGAVPLRKFISETAGLPLLIERLKLIECAAEKRKPMERARSMARANLARHHYRTLRARG